MKGKCLQKYGNFLPLNYFDQVVMRVDYDSVCNTGMTPQKFQSVPTDRFAL